MVQWGMNSRHPRAGVMMSIEVVATVKSGKTHYKEIGGDNESAKLSTNEKARYSRRRRVPNAPIGYMNSAVPKLMSLTCETRIYGRQSSTKKGGSRCIN